VFRRCAHCGASYVPKQLKAAASYCSRSCKDKAKNAKLKAARLQAKAVIRRCIRCGGVMPREMRTDALFCSEQCSYKAHYLPRSLRTNADQGDELGHERLAIFERDEWQCGICLRPVIAACGIPSRCAPRSITSFRFQRAAATIRPTFA
jgi:hypothetical protein